ncbi:MAG: hypothetical protein V1676_05160 [Candidatus Diapherotrites archaeon]
MARTIAFAFLCAAAALVILAGCAQEPTGEAAMQPSGVANGNPAGTGAGGGTPAGQFPAFEQGGDIAVSLRLTSNEIVVPSQVSAKDTNTLAGVCDKVCSFLGYTKYLLQFDVNRNYSCFCYREVCNDSEEGGQIVRNCSDEARMLYFRAA